MGPTSCQKLSKNVELKGSKCNGGTAQASSCELALYKFLLTKDLFNQLTSYLT